MNQYQRFFVQKWARLIATAICPTAGLKLSNEVMQSSNIGTSDVQEDMTKRIKQIAIKLNPSVKAKGIHA